MEWNDTECHLRDTIGMIVKLVACEKICYSADWAIVSE